MNPEESEVELDVENDIIPQIVPEKKNKRS